jgi:putative N6-adenine-specific DNA methylase
MNTPRPPYFAVCPRGLEALLEAELRAVGAADPVATPGGCAFGGPMAVAYRANLHSRIASRILLRMGGGSYRNEDELYQRARNIAWEQECSPRQSLRVDVTAHRSPLQSLQFATLKVKDAIVDRARDKSGERPDIDRVHPDVQVLAHLREATADFYLDLSGEALFKRGWRADKGEAPIKENLAAGLLLLAGWAPGMPLLDPFCGSGTLAIEAACMASGRAPGLDRGFAFERLLRFDRKTWSSVREEALAKVDDRAPMNILGRDISTQVVSVARSNAHRAGLGEAMRTGALRFEPGDAREGGPMVPAGMIVTNPPYGEQSSPRSASVPDLMANYATRLKHDFAGWTAWLLSSDLKLPSQMRLRESRKVVLYNGPLECRLFRFEMLAGSNRKPASNGA